jgi:glucose-6-phosphate 1-dehydrogenase
VDAKRSGVAYAGEPCAVVLFGASGDLAKRKVVPAMYDLANNQVFGSTYAIVGYARTPMTDESFRDSLGEAAQTMSEIGPIDPAKWKEFASNLHYHAGDYGNADDFTKLAKHLAELESSKELCGNRLFYLSTPPEVYPQIVEQLGRSGLAKPCSHNSWTRIIIEKPFGRDLASAKKLNEIVLGVFDESQIYRIDHYLGKDHRCGNAGGRTPRRLLRDHRRAPRHDPEPRPSAHFACRRRASRFLRCHRSTQ